jgi:hypothetical protein
MKMETSGLSDKFEWMGMGMQMASLLMVFHLKGKKQKENRKENKSM